MIDVNKITSTLAKLPDQQLQQYAQMHKADPYIMALAMSESNRRKELRAAGQGAQGMQEQPKVVDSEIAQMAPQQLPEDQGIGRLNAGNMNFAGGGIIAFADGGDVERYQSQGLVSPAQQFLRTTTGGKSWFLDVPSTMRDPSVPYYREIPSPFAGLADKQFATKEEALAAYNQLTPAGAQSPTAAPGSVPVSPAAMGARASASPYVSAAPVAPKSAEEAALLNRYPTTTSKAAPTADTGRTAPAANTPSTPVAAPSFNLDVAGITRSALEEAENKPNKFEPEFKALGKEKVKAKEDEVTGIEAIQKQFDNIYKGRKERQEAKEADIKDMGGKNLGLAFLNAGAAMMRKRGSIGEAIGEGIDTGSKQYVAGLDRINSAKDKLSEARDRLEEIEANRNELSARELNKARNEVKSVGIDVRQDLLKANMQMYNVNREMGLKMADNQIKVGIAQLEQSGATARTNAQIASSERLASQPTGEVRNAIILGTGKTDGERFDSGMKRIQEATADKSGMAAVKLLAETNAKLQAAGQAPVTMSELLSSAKEYSALMYPKVGNVQTTLARPGG